MASEPKRYAVFLKPSVEKALSKLSKKNQRLIGDRIGALAGDPRPVGNEQLSADIYRIRSGNYRIIYTVEDAILKVLVLTIGDRKEVYRNR